MAVAGALTTVAFDCGTKSFDKLHLKTFSLLDISPCIVNEPIIEKRKFVGQIVQNKLYDYSIVHQCKIKIKRTIRRCSWFGYLEPVENGLAEFFIDLSPESCKRLHDTHTYAYDATHVLTDLRVNQTSLRPMSLAGNAIDNSCNTGSYSDRFGTWNHVNVEAMISVTLAQYTAKVDLFNDKLMLRSGLTCKYSDTSCLDVENGLTFWETINVKDCIEDKLEVLFEGQIKIVIENRNNITKTHYFVEHNGFIASFKFSGMRRICHIEFIKTEFSNLYIIENKDFFLLRKSNVFPDLITYVNAKFVYAERDTRNQMGDLYKEIVHKRCEADVARLKETFTLAYLSPDLFAYNLMGPGYMAHVSGEVIHIIKCIPVEVKIRMNLTTCYKQIPVIYENSDMFLAAKTKILVKHGAATECSRLLPLTYKIASQWVSINPAVKSVSDPEIPSPDTKYTWSPKDVTQLATDGIYTEAEIRSYMEKLSFPMERESILDNTAAMISLERKRDITGPTSFLDMEYWTDFKNYYWRRFKDFGSISGGILSIMIITWFIIHTLKFLAESLAVGTLMTALGTCIQACCSKKRPENLQELTDTKERNEHTISQNTCTISLGNQKRKSKIPKPQKSLTNTLESNHNSIESLHTESSIPSIPPKTYAQIHELRPSNMFRKSM